MKLPDRDRLNEAISRARRITRDPDMIMIMDALQWYIDKTDGRPRLVYKSPPPKFSKREVRNAYQAAYMRDFRKGIRRRKKKDNQCDPSSSSLP